MDGRRLRHRQAHDGDRRGRDRGNVRHLLLHIHAPEDDPPGDREGPRRLPHGPARGGRQHLRPDQPHPLRNHLRRREPDQSRRAKHAEAHHHGRRPRPGELRQHILRLARGHRDLVVRSTASPAPGDHPEHPHEGPPDRVGPLRGRLRHHRGPPGGRDFSRHPDRRQRGVRDHFRSEQGVRQQPERGRRGAPPRKGPEHRGPEPRQRAQLVRDSSLDGHGLRGPRRRRGPQVQRRGFPALEGLGVRRRYAQHR